MVRQVGRSTFMPSAKGCPTGHRSSLHACLALGSKSSMREIGAGSTVAAGATVAAVATGLASVVATGAGGGMCTSADGRASGVVGTSAGAASLAQATPPAIAVTSFKNEPR